MHSIRQQRMILVLLLVCGVSVAIGLMVYALRDSMNFFYSPSEIYQQQAPVDQRIRIGGIVMTDSVVRSDDGLQVRFVVTDMAQQVQVQYQGILPDMFAENEGAVAAGKLNSDGVFVADEVLAKHDENYMPPEVNDSLQKAWQQKSEQFKAEEIR